MTNTTTSLAARELACQVILQTVNCAMGQVSAMVEDPLDYRQRRKEVAAAKSYIMSDEFQALCDDLYLPDNFVEKIRKKVFKTDRVWQAVFKFDKVVA